MKESEYNSIRNEILQRSKTAEQLPFFAITAIAVLFSWLATHPRRTGEAYYNQYLDAKFIDNHPIPRDLSFKELKDWFKPLLDVEREKL